LLADGLEAEFVEAAEPGEAGRGEGSVEHVEVFRMGSVGTSILAGPRLDTLSLSAVVLAAERSGLLTEHSVRVRALCKLDHLHRVDD
jgi:hypothetical protein